MTEYYKVRVLHTRGGKTGATMSSALLDKMPKDTMKKSPSTIVLIKWFSSRKEAILYAESIRKGNR